ncbi:MAG: flagellar basal body L-ring protein FlgH [Nitrospina sp.]|nr:MAG: flagellar basal body L-ring protein FlgH [Nitrospina sp.]
MKLNRVVSLILCLGLAACAGHENMHGKSSEDILASTIYPEVEYKPMEGSLWPGETSENFLFGDTKAKRVGDVVTVVLEEDFTSSQGATTDVSKNSSIGLETSAILGLPTNLGITNFLGSGNSFDPSLTASTARSTNGSGTTTRQGSMTGSIAALITDELPSGNFKIKGRRTVTINNEEQIMIIEGIIRRVDIGFDNTISSQKIANACIIYTGEGVISDEQNVGWLMRFFAKVWPF